MVFELEAPCGWVYRGIDILKRTNSQMPISDSNVQATATALQRGRGQKGALAYAEAQRSECARRHDPNGEAVWQRVSVAIQAMATDQDAVHRPAVDRSWLSRALHARRCAPLGN